MQYKVYNLALKTNQPDKDREHLRMEAELGLKMEYHPNIVYVGCAYEEDGKFYFLMKLIGNLPIDITQPISGNSLQDFMECNKKEQLKRLKSFAKCSNDETIKQAAKNKDLHKLYLYWIIQVCDGLEYAYSFGIDAHRDLKPDNLLIDKDGVLKICDFGLSVQNKIKYGVKEYAAPELLDVNSTTEPCVQTDIYALGQIFYQLFNESRLPNAQTYYHKSYGENQSYSLPNSKIYDDIFQKCCAIKPENRYKSLQDLRKDLEKKLGSNILVAKAKPVEPILCFQKAEGFFALEDYENAIKYINDAEKAGKDLSLNNLLTRAISYKNIGDYTNAGYDAIKIEQLIIKLRKEYRVEDVSRYVGDKKSLMTIININEYNKAKQKELDQCQAVADYLQGAGMLCLDKDARRELETDYLNCPIEEAVLDHFNKALSLGFETGDMHYFCAKYYEKFKKYADVVHHLDRAEKLNFIMRDLYKMRSNAHISLLKDELLLSEGTGNSKHKQAIIKYASRVTQDLEKVLNLDGGSYKLYCWLAYVYFILQEYNAVNSKEKKETNNQVIHYLSWAFDFIEKEPSDKQGMAAFELGKLCMMCNAQEIGAEAFKKALSLNPDYSGTIELMCYEKDKDSWVEEIFPK